MIDDQYRVGNKIFAAIQNVRMFFESKSFR